MRRVWTAITVAAVVAVAQPAGALADSPGWSIQPSPSPAGASSSVLTAVSCPADGHCIAVGYEIKSGVAGPLAEVWTGSAWTISPTPNAPGQGTLSGVSCLPTGACMAVGSSVSTNEVERPLALAWNGHTWATQPTPPIGAGGAGLDSVSCVAPDSCTAVGEFTGRGLNAQPQPLAEHWNGTGWTVQATPNPQAENGSSLSSVACTAPDACTAGGNYAYADVAQAIFALRWNGTDWLGQAQPNPGGQEENAEDSVACGGSAACTAVGSWVNLADTQLTLAEGWNGTSWVQETTPNPAGATGAGLNGVACPVASDCTAVGYSTGSGDAGATLAEHWNGSSWALQSTPNPGDAVFSILSGVDCPASGRCVAVGNYYDGSATETLVERESP